MSDHYSNTLYILLHGDDCKASTPSGCDILIRSIYNINVCYFVNLISKDKWLFL